MVCPAGQLWSHELAAQPLDQFSIAGAVEDDAALHCPCCWSAGGLCRCAVPCLGTKSGQDAHPIGLHVGSPALPPLAAAHRLPSLARHPHPPRVAAAAAATAARQAPFASFAALLSQPKVAATAALAGFTAASERQRQLLDRHLQCSGRSQQVQCSGCASSHSSD